MHWKASKIKNFKRLEYFKKQYLKKNYILKLLNFFLNPKIYYRLKNPGILFLIESNFKTNYILIILLCISIT